ncbi:MAG TPA: heavy metal-responsive transcriptional regulator [Gemmata sp.]|nr:heavy metal-responsive transcriptional regulator [Gemmata sp.]
MMTSGQLAARAGVGVETLRFYEREGLLPEPTRTAAGYRQYPLGAVERVRFVRRAQLFGFQLRDVRQLLSLRDDPDATRADVRDLAAAKLAEIEQRLRDLEAMRDDLKGLVEQCDGHGAAAHCPILTAITDDEIPRA